VTDLLETVPAARLIPEICVVAAAEVADNLAESAYWPDYLSELAVELPETGADKSAIAVVSRTATAAAAVLVLPVTAKNNYC
jgi:hypothetical protein